VSGIGIIEELDAHQRNYNSDRIAERRGNDISRKIRPMIVTVKELRSLWEQLNMEHALLIWGEPIPKK